MKNYRLQTSVLDKYLIFPFLWLACGILLFSPLHARQLSVEQLRTEYRINPVGIDEVKPRLSWIIQSNLNNTEQVAYQLQVVKSEPVFDSAEYLVWDTGKIESNRSVQKIYEGPEPDSRTRYFWRVRVWDNHNRTSDWSNTAFWEMGLMNPENWRAVWIEPDLNEDISRSSPAPMLRREFQAQGNVERAMVYVTAHGVYEMEINGERVGDHILSPGWTSYHNRLQYQTFDVTDLLNTGENAVGVMLGDGWYRGYIGWSDQRNYYGNTLGLLMQMEITYSSGDTEIITTDENWRASTGPILKSDIYNGEHYDARLEMDGWSRPGFDDNGWAGIRIADHTKSGLIGQQAPPVRKIQELKPRKIFVTPEGDTVADMGQNMIGWIRLHVEGAAGTAITLRHAEVLDRDGNFYTENLRAADQTNTYILKGEGIEIWEPRFSFQGFRYVAVDGYPGELTTEDLTGVVLHSDIEPTGHFQSSNPWINRLQHNIIWGQKGNFLDVPTDCPQRDERMGWTGDIQVFAGTANLYMNTASFLTKWLEDLAADQFEDGRIPHVVPNVLGGNAGGSSGWADAGLIVPWSLYQSFGDIRILKRQYESMKAWVTYMEQRAARNENTYLWEGDFTFGDWLSFNTTRSDYPGAFTDKDLINTAFFAHSSHLLSKAAGLLGKNDDQAYYADLYEKIRKAFQDEYVTPGGRVMSNTQTAYLLALRFGLLTDDQIPAAVNHLVGAINLHGHLTTGFLGTPYLNPILSEFGQYDLAYLLLLRKDYPSWLYPVTMGATTIWERWDGIRPDGTFQDEGMNSFNHYAYGAIGEWLFSDIAGIRIAEPGYSRFQVIPVPGGDLNHARAILHSPFGEIKSSWDIEEDRFTLEIEVPVNTVAEVHLPYADRANVRVNGRILSGTEEIRRSEQVGSDVLIEVGSGRYVFRYHSETLAEVYRNGITEAEEIEKETIQADDDLALLLTKKPVRELFSEYFPALAQSPWLSQVMGFPLDVALSSLPAEFEISRSEYQEFMNELEKLLSE
ncbi:MAG: alpha-L-rhamnosidase [Balneolaceae bacterium]|nr:MAG: alpha-L-rhamnosidase [Balneolaceae bacterium]